MMAKLDGQQPGGMDQGAEKVLPAKIQTLGFLVTRASGLCDRVSEITSRFGVPVPVSDRNTPGTRESQDYITQLELHLSAMDELIQSMDSYLTELERVI